MKKIYFVCFLISNILLYGQSSITPWPDWAKSSTIYEINIRQYSKKGDIKSVQKDLPRLKNLGVDILWLMPIHPIGKIKSKGEWGSPYSVKDYQGVHPKYGTIMDLKNFVNTAHKMGMRVILDWVGNHTAWDHPWIKSNPEFYVKRGDTISHAANNDGSLTDWYDVADLDYENRNMRKKMIDALSFWVREAKIDGFRCDVGGMMPVDFWNEAKIALAKINPKIYMLVEWEEDSKLIDEGGFHTLYGWSMHSLSKEIAKGKKNATDFETYLNNRRLKYPAQTTFMYFTSNHDENTWSDIASKRYGKAEDLMSVLTFTMEGGIPLIYNSQESGEKHSLKFFDKDEINWGNYGKTDFYKKLIQLKHQYKPLWNSTYGSKMDRINQGDDVYAFVRKKGNQAVWVILNFSDKPQVTTLTEEINGAKDWFSNTPYNYSLDKEISLEPFEYKVIVK